MQCTTVLLFVKHTDVTLTYERRKRTARAGAFHKQSRCASCLDRLRSVQFVRLSRLRSVTFADSTFLSNESREAISSITKEPDLERWRRAREDEGRSQQSRSAGNSVGMAFVGALAGLAVGGAGACLYAVRPRDPVFEVTEINLKGLNLRFCTDSPMLIVELILMIKVTNQNIVPIEYTSTIMDIFYRGDLLGQAQVNADSQDANCSRVIEVPCKLDGLEMTNHVKDLFKDVTKREMELHSVVTIAGHARVWKWNHNFEVHVTSDIKVDPIFLNVKDQENRAELELEPPL